jgi:hypothetical protein
MNIIKGAQYIFKGKKELFFPKEKRTGSFNSLRSCRARPQGRVCCEDFFSEKFLKINYNGYEEV